MEGTFDAVFGILLLAYTFGDITRLLRKAYASSVSAVDVEIALCVKGDAERCRVVGSAFGGNGQIVAAFPFEAGRCLIDNVPKPLAFEDVALGRYRPLLIERGK